MTFNKLTINDLKNIDEAIKSNPLFKNYMASEYTPLFLLTWGSEYEICYDETDIFIKGKYDKLFFLPPISNNITNAYNKLKNNFSDFYIYGLTDELNVINGEHFRNLDEYIYDNTLLTLKGKSLHNKRNLVNQFLKTNYVFKSYDSSDYQNIIDLFNEWNKTNNIDYELAIIKKALTLLDSYSFCDCLYLDNKLIAFSIGTIYNNIGYCFFEKADTSVKGSYQAINYLSSNKHFKDCTYINRQEDLGLEHLRFAKLSYNPIMILKKYKKSYL